jgi:hypothetical protein
MCHDDWIVPLLLPGISRKCFVNHLTVEPVATGKGDYLMTRYLIAPAIAFLLLSGCSDSSDPTRGGHQAVNQPAHVSKPAPEEQAQVATGLDGLPPEDRALAEAQQFCAVEPENRLGMMGTPVKVLVNDEPVFLCCKACKPTALAEPEKTLAKARELKKASETPGH